MCQALSALRERLFQHAKHGAWEEPSTPSLRSPLRILPQQLPHPLWAQPLTPTSLQLPQQASGAPAYLSLRRAPRGALPACPAWKSPALPSKFCPNVTFPIKPPCKFPAASPRGAGSCEPCVWSFSTLIPPRGAVTSNVAIPSTSLGRTGRRPQVKRNKLVNYTDENTEAQRTHPPPSVPMARAGRHTRSLEEARIYSLGGWKHCRKAVPRLP